MPALLYCRTGPMSGASFSLDAESTVGRTGENAVTLSDDRVSSRHARIWPDPDSGEWMVQDLESRNGTLVDGSPATEPVRLGDLSVVTFAGRFDFIFQVVASEGVDAPSARAPAPAAARTPAEDVETRMGGAPPSLPDMDAGDDGVRTKVGGAPPSLPDVGSPADDVRTRLGGEAPSLPDLERDEDDAEEVRTRLGGAAPDLPDTGSSSTGGDPGGDMRTRAGGAPPDLPDVSGSAETVGPGAASGPAGTGAVFTLHVRSSETDVSEFELQPGKNVVGRSGDADIRIDDASLSRSHAVITVDGARITVRDDGSKNGTFIDGEKVTAARALTPSNRLRLGFRIEAWITGA